jgi:hypothetical protein
MAAHTTGVSAQANTACGPGQVWGRIRLAEPDKGVGGQVPIKVPPIKSPATNFQNPGQV